jgi:hypothetical protein
MAPRPRWAPFPLVDLEAPGRDRVVVADLPFDREDPDRPAGRLVAVVTVSNRVLPQRPRHGDTTPISRLHRDDHRNDHRALTGAITDQATERLAGHPV